MPSTARNRPQGKDSSHQPGSLSLSNRSNNSSLKKSQKLSQKLTSVGKFTNTSDRLTFGHGSRNAEPHLTGLHQTTLLDKPLPQILRHVLKKGKETMLSNGLLTEGSDLDRYEFPTYDISDASSCTPRELTLSLVKQRDFLLNRVLGLTEITLQNNKQKYAKKKDLVKECEMHDRLAIK
jgi:hypothetical protein